MPESTAQQYQRAILYDPNDLTIIGLDTKDGEEHPLYDPRIKLPISEPMVLNLMAFGILEPIEIRMNGAVAEVVNGRRRVRHAREANKRLKKMGSDEIRVPCTIKRGDDGHLFGISVSANEHREDDTPMAKAEKAQRMLDLGKTEDDVAVAFGVTKVAVKQWLKLLELSAYVRKLVDKRAISASAAAKFADLGHDEQKEAVDKLLAESGGKATTKKAKTAAKKKAKGDEAAYDAPGKRMIRKVLINNESDEALDEGQTKILKWVLGEIGPTSIKGLSGLMVDPDEETEEE